MLSNFRFFSPRKIAFGRIVNLFGIQIIRSILARYIFWRKISSEADLAIISNSIKNDGYYIWKGFAQSDRLELLRKEFIFAIENPRFVTKRVYDKYGQLRETAKINECDWEFFPETQKLLKTNKLLNMLIFNKKVMHLEYSFWRLSKSLPSGRFEVNKDRSNSDFHIDTFHPIFKFFLYLDDVGPNDGPHEYIKYSNHIFNSRLIDEYINSISDLLDSPRASSWYIDRAHGKITSMCYPAGTLVISDTSGYHRMKKLSDNGLRKCIYINLRYRPF